ncbi:MAG: ATP-binding protein, partial [Candidatus Micrarchaeota archaeon]
MTWLTSGNLAPQRVMNRDLGRRRFFVHPPEPPREHIMHPPSDSIYLGRTKLLGVPVYWTYKNLANPHMLICGVTGCGKSYTVKSFLTRAALVWGTNALILDWAGEYGEWVEQANGKVVALGRGSYINLLDLGGMKPIDRIKQIIGALGILTDIDEYPEQKRLTEKAIERAYEEKKIRLTERQEKKISPPTLKDVERILKSWAKKESSVARREDLEEAIYRIGKFTVKGNDYFAEQSTVKIDGLASSGLVCVDLHGLPSEAFRSLAGLTILQFIKEQMRDEGWSPTKGIKTFIVADEAWKIAQDDKSDLIAIVREGRKYQFGLIVASQNPTDVNKAIFSNVGTLVIMRLQLKEFKDYVRGSLNYSDFIQSEIDRFGVGDAALHMVFQTKADFPQTFILNKIDGEEPLVTIEIKGVDGMRALEFEREEFRKKLV